MVANAPSGRGGGTHAIYYVRSHGLASIYLEDWMVADFSSERDSMRAYVSTYLYIYIYIYIDIKHIDNIST